MTAPINWLPAKSGAMQSTTRSPNTGLPIYCPFCYATTLVFQKDLANPIKRFICGGCKESLIKGMLIIDIDKWHVYQGLKLKDPCGNPEGWCVCKLYASRSKPINPKFIKELENLRDQKFIPSHLSYLNKR